MSTRSEPIRMAWFSTNSMISSGEIYSYCKKYRYDLWRIWDTNLKYLMVIGLNPCAADRTISDPYLKRCAVFARKWGFGGIHLCNLFGFQVSNSKVLLLHHDPVGKDNDYHIERVAGESGMVLAAWGNLGDHMLRDEAVMAITGKLNINVRHMGMTIKAHPVNLLFVSQRTIPLTFC